MAITKLTNSGIATGGVLKYDSMLAGNNPYIPLDDFELIAATVLSSTTTEVNFSNISQNYTHLLFVGGVRTNASNTNGGFNLEYNSSTASTGNEIRQILFKITSTTVYGSSSGGALAYISMLGAGSQSNANTFGYFRVLIPTYKQTDKYRASYTQSGMDTNTVSNGSLDDASLGQSTNSIPSTSALTSLRCYTANNFVSGSNFALYGVI